MNQPIANRIGPPFAFKSFLLLFLGAILLIGLLLWPFVPTLVLSFLLTVVFKPAFRLLHRKLSAPLASLLTCILILVIVLLPLYFFSVALGREAFALYQLGKGANLGHLLKENLQGNGLIAKAQEILDGLGLRFGPEGFSQTLSELAGNLGLFLYNQLGSWVANLLHVAVHFCLMIVIIYFLLIDDERLVNFLVRLSPLPDDHDRRLVRKFEEIAWATLIVNGVCAVIQGLLGGLVFALFGLDSPALWGAIMCVLAFLPILGMGMVIVPAAFFLLVKGQIFGGFFMLAFFVFLNITIEHLLKSKMMGNRIEMHSLLAFMSILGGLSAFGVMGMLYGPLIVTAFLTLADIYLGIYGRSVKAGG